MGGCILLDSALPCSAQTGDYTYSGTEQTITLDPGLYDITAYGAQGGSSYFGSAGGLGAEMSGEFNFSASTTLTLLVGGAGAGGGEFLGGGIFTGSAGGTGGGGGGGGGFYGDGDDGQDCGGGGSFFSGGSGGSASYLDGYYGYGGYCGGGGYSGGGSGGDFGNGGGGSIIDSSAIMVLTEVSGVASPDDSPNGEIIITAVPEPTTLALLAFGVPACFVFRRRALL